MIEIDLEPEVEAWLLALPYGHYQRVMRNVDDYLVTGGIPDGDHVKKLQAAEGVYELRVCARPHYLADQLLETWWPADHSADFLPEDPRWYPEGRCGPSCPSYEHLPDRS